MGYSTLILLFFTLGVHFSAFGALGVRADIKMIPLGGPTHINYALLHVVLDKHGEISDVISGRPKGQLLFKNEKGDILSQMSSAFKDSEMDCLYDEQEYACPLSPRRLDVANFQRACEVEFKIFDGENLIGEMARPFGECRQWEDSVEDYDLFFHSKVKRKRQKREASPYERPALLEVKFQLGIKGSVLPHEEVWGTLVAVDGKMMPIYSDSFTAYPQDFSGKNRLAAFKKVLLPSIWKRACGLLLSVDYGGRLREIDRGNNERFIELGNCLDFDGSHEVDLAAGLRRVERGVEIALFNLGTHKSFQSFFYHYSSLTT
ncbi:MAG: hypothetical protein OXB88_05135 [Bacteriovoracales bacterium]|nr:hypothetical protein [Bacteriovoracales bacterium]